MFVKFSFSQIFSQGPGGGRREAKVGRARQIKKNEGVTTNTSEQHEGDTTYEESIQRKSEEDFDTRQFLVISHDIWILFSEYGKADSTLRSSRAVPHPSTNRALCRLTSEVGRDPVHSTRYGRQRKSYYEEHIYD